MTQLNALIIGAGLCGVSLASELTNATEFTFEIWDKGRSVGGRMATRRFQSNGDAKADHGAQFFTLRNIKTKSLLQDWQQKQWIHPWPQFSPNPLGETRWIAAGGMNQLMKKSCAPFADKIRTGLTVTKVHAEPNGAFRVHAITEEQKEVTCTVEHLIFTCPVPQSLALCDRSQLLIPPTERQILEQISYAPCVAAFIRCRSEQQWVIPMQNQMNWPQGVRFIADNFQKGISSEPILTIHMDPEWSATHYDDEIESIQNEIIHQLAAHLDQNDILDIQLKKWRYSQAVHTSVLPYLSCKISGSKGKLWFGGDAFASTHPLQAGRVENAILSGLFCADELLNR